MFKCGSAVHVSGMWWYVSNPDTHISCPLQNSVLTRCPRPPVTAHSFLSAWPQTAQKQLVSKCFHMHTGIPGYANRSGILMRFVASFPQLFTASGDTICLKFGGVWEMLWIFKVGRWTHNRCMKINKSTTVSNGVGASSFEIWTANLAQLLTLGTQTNLWSFIFGDSNWKFCKVGYLVGTLKPDTRMQIFLIWDLLLLYIQEQYTLERGMRDEELLQGIVLFNQLSLWTVSQLHGIVVLFNQLSLWTVSCMESYFSTSCPSRQSASCLLQMAFTSDWNFSRVIHWMFWEVTECFFLWGLDQAQREKEQLVVRQKVLWQKVHHEWM